MDRETKELTTTNGNKVVIYTYLTAKENRDIRRLLYAHMQIENPEEQAAGETPKISKMPLAAALEREDKMMEIVIVSFNDVEQDALEKVLNLPSNEYDELVKQINAIINKDFQKAT